MGRKRKIDTQLQLPTRVYYRHGAFYYVHHDGRWERLGTDIRNAKRRAGVMNDPSGLFGTLSYWLDKFIVDCETRIGLSKEAKGLAPRTVDDYKDNAAYLKSYFGKMRPGEVEPHHVGKYLELGRRNERAVRANREKACLSSAFTWLMLQSESGFKGPNPCIGVKRNPEFKNDRYVTDDQMIAVIDAAPRMVSALLRLVYRTLQRPEDILTWDRSNLVVRDGRRILRVEQSKMSTRAGKTVDIEISEDIETILRDLKVNTDGTAVGPGMPFLHRRDGSGYTYSGLNSMLKRAVKKASVEHPNTGELEAVATFGFYSMKGKGATDMWRASVPLEQIQVLCGHESVTTTEKYVKAGWTEIVSPNSRAVVKTQGRRNA